MKKDFGSLLAGSEYGKTGAWVGGQASFGGAGLLGNEDDAFAFEFGAQFVAWAQTENFA